MNARKVVWLILQEIQIRSYPASIYPASINANALSLFLSFLYPDLIKEGKKSLYFF